MQFADYFSDIIAYIRTLSSLNGWTISTNRIFTEAELRGTPNKVIIIDKVGEQMHNRFKMGHIDLMIRGFDTQSSDKGTLEALSRFQEQFLNRLSPNGRIANISDSNPTGVVIQGNTVIQKFAPSRGVSYMKKDSPSNLVFFSMSVMVGYNDKRTSIRS